MTPATRTVRTPTLDIACRDWAPEGDRGVRTPVVAVHGFPDDARSWDGVASRLADQGHRVVAPDLRGVGGTRFLSDHTPRSGQLGALAQDLLDLLDALDLDRVVLIGQDWGARATQAVAATTPDRVERLVSLGGYAISWNDGGPPSYPQLHALWYQFLLALDWGEGVLRADARGFARHLWRLWSPTWGPASAVDAAFAETAPSFDTPDFVDVVLSGYRDHPGAATRDDRYTALERRLADGPPVHVPTVLLYGADDGLEPDGPDRDLDAGRFTDLVAASTVQRAGHFLHREQPDAVVSAVSSRSGAQGVAARSRSRSR